MAQRVFFVGGNWKCNGTTSFARDLVTGLNGGEINCDVVIAPPAPYLVVTNETVTHPRISVSAQNCYPEGGAFTGEVSVDMLKDLQIPYVIVGHSERRKYFAETYEDMIGKKVAAALAGGLKVIACIGEVLEERKNGTTEKVVEAQMKALAQNIKPEQWKNVVIAYEPVWAIGTGLTATPAQAQQVHAFIRNFIKTTVSQSIALSVRIIYGGSVKPQNCNELAKESDIDGFLVGGCSLKTGDFLKIIAAASSSSTTLAKM